MRIIPSRERRPAHFPRSSKNAISGRSNWTLALKKKRFLLHFKNCMFLCARAPQHMCRGQTVGIGSLYPTWVSGLAAGAFTRGLDPVLTGRGSWGGGGDRRGTDGDRAQHFCVASAGACGVRPAHRAAEGPRKDGGGQPAGSEPSVRAAAPGSARATLHNAPG